MYTFTEVIENMHSGRPSTGIIRFPEGLRAGGGWDDEPDVVRGVRGSARSVSFERGGSAHPRGARSTSGVRGRQEDDEYKVSVYGFLPRLQVRSRINGLKTKVSTLVFYHSHCSRYSIGNKSNCPLS